MLMRLWIVILTTFLVFANGCGPTARAATGEGEKPLRFGLISLNHPLVIYRQYLPFLEYLSEVTPWTFELVLSQDYGKVVQGLERGELDVALLAGLTFLDVRKRANVTPICTVLDKDGTPTSRTVFVARDDNLAITSLADLRGRRVAFGSHRSTASYLAPLDHLARKGIAPRDLSGTDNLPTHDAVARAVLRGQFDAGAMGAPMARRYIGSGLRIIEATEPFPGFIIVGRAGLDADVLEGLRKTLLAVDAASPAMTKRIQEWNEVLRYGFGPVDGAAYEVIEAMERRMEKAGLPHREGE